MDTLHRAGFSPAPWRLRAQADSHDEVLVLTNSFSRLAGWFSLLNRFAL
jgi:hypothetical protein